MTRFVSPWVAIIIALIPAAAVAQQNYTLVNLTAGSPYVQTSANGINNAGHITGFGVLPVSGQIDAFLYSNGTFHDLGTFGFPAADGITINSTDQLGVDGIQPGSTALFYSNGQVVQIGNVDGGYSYCAAINNHGDIVGAARNGDGNEVGFSWIGGVFTDLSPLGFILTTNFNDSDQIIGASGYYWHYGSSYHALLYSNGVATDLGSLTGNPRTNTEPYGINAAGQIVGYSQWSDGVNHAFLYSNGTMQDLGTIGTEYATAVAINNNGVIVGNLTNAYNANLGAFVYANGAMTDLSTLISSGGDGWSALTVSGLNDGGYIVGTGTYNGGSQGFLLIPTGPAAVGNLQVALPSAISEAAPNPFRADTRIEFQVSARAAAGNIRLQIFDPAGRRVATLLDQRLDPGPHSIFWNGRADGGAALQSGVYLAHLSLLDGSMSEKLVLMK